MQTEHGDIDVARIGTLLGDGRRTRMIMALMDGRALAATTLAMEAGIASSTASEHLAKLVDGGLLTCLQSGRHRYYKLSGPHIGQAIEALAGIAAPAHVRSLDEGTKAHAIRFARTCYDHMAGKLGVHILDALLERDALVRVAETAPRLHHADPVVLGAGGEYRYEVTASGRTFFTELDITLGSSGRPLTRYCIDWSEQRHHLGGALGAALFAHSLSHGWLRRAPKGRALIITPEGRTGFNELYGIPLASLACKPYTRK